MTTRIGVAITVALFLIGAASAADRTGVATLEMLEQRRAPQNIPVEDYASITLNEEGTAAVSAEIDNMASAAAAVRALERAYGVKSCIEFGVDSSSIRFPFKIRANQRLVDALDALGESSNGRVRWLLLDGRVIVTFALDPEDSSFLERVVTVDIDALTIGEALAQIEADYNKQHHDLPLITQTMCLDIDWDAPVSPARQRFVLKGEFALREIVLALIRHTQDDEFLYSSSVSKDRLQRYYLGVSLRRVNSRDAFETEAEYRQIRERSRAQWERLDAYFARGTVETGAEAAQDAP